MKSSGTVNMVDGSSLIRNRRRIRALIIVKLGAYGSCVSVEMICSVCFWRRSL